jgi:membrane associated rhomboid family serine protease
MGWQDRAYNQENNGGVPPVMFRFPPFTRLTVAIILLCFFVFVAQSVTRPPIEALMVGDHGPVEKWCALTFVGGKAFMQPWRFITYQYLHSGSGHIFWNMLILYFFLPTLEGFWGWRKALAFYTAGGVVAGLAYGALTLVAPDHGLIGASGAIFAALGAVALLSPSRQIWLFFFSIPIRVFAGLIAAFYLLTVVGERDLSNAAHLGGLAFGFFAPMIGGPILYRYRQKYRRMKIQRDAAYEVREQEEIDHILEKVSHQGMQSLTHAEKRALQRATERQRKQEVARGRRAF